MIDTSRKFVSTSKLEVGDRFSLKRVVQRAKISNQVYPQRTIKGDKRLLNREQPQAVDVAGSLFLIRILVFRFEFWSGSGSGGGLNVGRYFLKLNFVGEAGIIMAS